MISSRTYIDLIYSRHKHSGIPILGAIGCYMSNYNLLKKCVSNNLPYITIVEDMLILIRCLYKMFLPNNVTVLIRQIILIIILIIITIIFIINIVI